MGGTGINWGFPGLGRGRGHLIMSQASRYLGAGACPHSKLHANFVELECAVRARAHSKGDSDPRAQARTVPRMTVTVMQHIDSDLWEADSRTCS